MFLARVTGRLVATHCTPDLEEVPFQWVQPLDEDGLACGAQQVACAVISSGPGDLVQVMDGREAALACPETFVPVDATIVGFVEEVTRLGERIGEPVPGEKAGG